MTQYDIMLNVNLLSLVIKVDALVASLPADQKRAYDAEVQRQRDSKLNAFLTGYKLSPEDEQTFRNLFEQMPF